MILNEIIRAFSEQITSLLESFWQTVLVAIIFFPIDWSIFVTPTIYWQGLGWLVLLDFVSGILKPVFTDVAFNPQRFIKTAYKISFYVIITTAVTIGDNVFPKALGLLQYLVYLWLYVREIKSIARNYGKLKPFMHFTEKVKDKGVTNISIQDLFGDNSHED